MAKIKVNNTEITIIEVNERDYISITEMANAKESKARAADIIKNWVRTRYTLEFLGTWEKLITLALKWSNLTTLMNVLKQDNIE